MSLPSLIELKLAAGRARDESDVVELVLTNPALARISHHKDTKDTKRKEAKELRGDYEEHDA